MSTYKDLISAIATRGDITVQGIAKEMLVSVPTAKKMIQELIDLEVIYKAGKKQGAEGRPAASYQICDGSIKIVSVEILMKQLRIATVDLNGNIYDYSEMEEFELKDSIISYNTIIDFIVDYISNIDFNPEGVAISMTGRVDINSGRNRNFFSNIKLSISQMIEKKTGLVTYMTNDTISYALYEKMFGSLRNIDDALYVNLSRGLGLGIFSNGKLAVGTSGYAGEFGHIQRGQIPRLCICGKRNCLGSEVSGYAVEEDFKELNIINGNSKELKYNRIIELSNRGDKVSKDLITHIGYRLGEELATLITLMNPKHIAISGTFYHAGDRLINAVKNGAEQFSLSEPLEEVTIELSPWEPKYGVIGGAINFFRQVEYIKSI